MRENEKVELSSIQATAYWWINQIRNKVKEIGLEKLSDKSEVKFAQTFYNFTEVEWRKLYLELVEYIAKDVENYIPQGYTFDIDAFSQDTDKGGHDRIDCEISKIIKQSVPDIRIASRSSKDSVIYTNMFGVSIWYKSCGISKLPTKYEPSYLLTGDANMISQQISKEDNGFVYSKELQRKDGSNKHKCN